MLSIPMSFSSGVRPSLGPRAELRAFAVLAIIVAVVTASCASSGPGAARRPGTGEKLDITEAQLQIKVRSLADPFSGLIEETVWALWQTTDDPSDYQRLLIWQINLTTSIQRATFQPNPIAALFDTWALIEQFREYVVSGTAPSFTDEQRVIVLRTIDRMDSDLFAIAVEAAGEDDARKVQALIKAWADDHPVNRFAVRDSPQGEMAEWSARADLGALATVKNLGATLDDVMTRLDLYAEYVPKQASWHAQAVAYGWVGPDETTGLLADLSTTASAFDRIATSLEGYPEAVSEERRIVLEAVQHEREQVLAELLQKITELESFVQDQRIDFVENQLRVEREAIFEAIAAERAIVVDAAIKERADTMDDLEAMVDDLVERSTAKIVDHFFLRAAQLVAVLLVGLAFIAVGAVMLWKKS